VGMNLETMMNQELDMPLRSRSIVLTG